MCVPGCRRGGAHALSRRGFFTGAAAAAPAFRDGGHAGAGAAQLQDGRRSDPHAVAGLPDLLRRAGHRDRKKLRLQEGRVQSSTGGTSLEHAGTHVDAPIHYSENGRDRRAIPAEQLVVPLAVVDVVGEGRAATPTTR